MRHNKTASAKYETYIIMTCKTSAKLRPSVIETADRAYPSRETNPSVGTSSHATGWRVVMYFWRLACGYSILEDAEISQFHNKIWRKFASFPNLLNFITYLFEPETIAWPTVQLERRKVVQTSSNDDHCMTSWLKFIGWMQFHQKTGKKKTPKEMLMAAKNCVAISKLSCFPTAS